MGGRRTVMTCSFCGQSQDRVRRLIAWPGRVFSCDECVRLCNKIIASDLPPATAQPSGHVRPAGAPPRRIWLQRLLPHRIEVTEAASDRVEETVLPKGVRLA